MGHVGHVPLFFQLEGQQLLVSYGYTFVVEPEYRGYAPLLLDQYENQKDADVVVGHQVNLASLESHLALGAQPVPLGAWDRKAVWITAQQEFVADWLGRKNSPAAGLLSRPAALALSTKDAWHRMLLRGRARRDVEVEMRTAFDERFDLSGRSSALNIRGDCWRFGHGRCSNGGITSRCVKSAFG